jgi:GNAT superfamily N-acetyltransferase
MRTSPTPSTTSAPRAQHPPVTVTRASGPRLRVLDPADLGLAVALLARGFAQEPGSRELFPDPELRRRMSELALAKELRRTLPHATVHGMEHDHDLLAAAIWHPPHTRPRSMQGTFRAAGDLLTSAPVLARGLPHLGAVARRHGRGGLQLQRTRRDAIDTASRGPSWHLAILATDPRHRGRGLARRLLEHVLDRCDADGLAAWLETTDPVNPPLYERFGFRTVAHLEDAAWLPGLWVMRREPGRG